MTAISGPCSTSGGCRCSSFLSDAATPEIYTLSLHDALPICLALTEERCQELDLPLMVEHNTSNYGTADRKSTRLNSSHLGTSYAVFCLKKKSQWGEPVLAAVHPQRRQLAEVRSRAERLNGRE